MDKEFVVVYWGHGSKRYTAVGMKDEETAQNYARKLRDEYKTECKIVPMPSRVEMAKRTDALPKQSQGLW